MQNHLPVVHLDILGGLRVSGDGLDLSGRAAQKKRLALLALLGATPGGALSRDRIAGLLWSEADGERARHQVAACVYDLRRVLGEDALVSAADEVRLNLEHVRCDVCRFQAAASRGEWAEAMHLYRGPLLDGFFLSNAPEFERWLDGERDRLARLFGSVLEAEAERRAAAGDLTGSAECWHRLAACDPFDSRVALQLMEALEAAGNPAGAVRQAELHIDRVQEELGIEPSPLVAAALDRLRRPAAAPRQAVQDAVPSGAPSQNAPTGTRPAGPARADPGAADSPPLPARAAASRAAPRPHTGDAAEARARRGGAVAWADALRGRGRLLLAPAVLALGVIVLLALAPGWPGSSARPTGSNRAVAVFPLTVHGSQDPEFLQQGLTELLTRSFGEAAGPTVASGTVLRQLQGSGLDPAGDPEGSAKIARELDAGRFLVGSVTESGGLLRAHVVLYSADEAHPRVLADVTVDAPAGDLFSLTDRITRDLLSRQGGPASARLTRSAGLTTESLAAFREYLAGEEALRRAEYDIAMASFQRAVAIDSTFALAYFRLAIAGGLLDREPNASILALEGAAPAALDRALARVARLPEQDQRHLHAYAAYRLGRADEAEQRYLALLRDYPDDLEARFQLADVLFRYNAQRGRSPVEAKPHYDQVLAADPEFLCPI